VSNFPLNFAPLKRTLDFVSNCRFSLNIDVYSEPFRVTSLSCSNLCFSLSDRNKELVIQTRHNSMNVELLWDVAQWIALQSVNWVILRFIVFGFQTRLSFWICIDQLINMALRWNMSHLNGLYLNQIHAWHEWNRKHFHIHQFNQFWFQRMLKFLDRNAFHLVNHFHQSNLNQIQWKNVFRNYTKKNNEVKDNLYRYVYLYNPKTQIRIRLTEKDLLENRSRIIKVIKIRKILWKL
jgi:hypothetical protein